MFCLFDTSCYFARVTFPTNYFERNEIKFQDYVEKFNGLMFTHGVKKNRK